MRGINLKGHRFGLLTAIECVGKRNTFRLWRCKCDCGNIVDVTSGHLRNGDTVSCGCYNRKNQAELHKTHGMKGTPLYRSWLSMRSRCYLKSSNRYERYGGRGIIVCNQWKNSFKDFMEWSIANGYKEGLSIDRINNDGNYCPENCRWSTDKVQSNNKSTNHRINGKTISEWATIFNMNYNTLELRINRYGLSLREAVEKRVRKTSKRSSFVPADNVSKETLMMIQES